MRKQVIALLIGAGAMWSYAVPAGALCDFDAPAKARQLRLEMVRTFTECPAEGSATHCEPVVPLSAYEFDSAGRCALKLKVDVEESCSDIGNYRDEPCQTLAVAGKCRGVLRPGGTDPIDGTDDAGWTVRVKTRYTVDRHMFEPPDDGDRTHIDFEYEGVFSVPKGGSIKTKTLWPRDLSQLFGSPYRQYAPACASVEIVSVVIVDPDQDAFAVPGMSTR